MLDWVLLLPMSAPLGPWEWLVPTGSPPCPWLGPIEPWADVFPWWRGWVRPIGSPLFLWLYPIELWNCWCPGQRMICPLEHRRSHTRRAGPEEPAQGQLSPGIGRRGWVECYALFSLFSHASGVGSSSRVEAPRSASRVGLVGRSSGLGLLLRFGWLKWVRTGQSGGLGAPLIPALGRRRRPPASGSGALW